MEYILHIVVMLNIYIILVLSTNLTAGMANLLTLCQASFYGIGAYAGAYLLMRFNLPFILVALIVMPLAGAFSLIISFASIKLKNDYFVLASLGFQMIVYTILYNWISVTRGPYGISAIPSIKLFGIISLSNIWAYALFTVFVSAILIFVFMRIKKSPYGRVLKAMRNEESHVMALGKNTVAFKSWAFLLSAAFSSIAGVIYASYVNYIDPTSFTLDESLFIISALFIGGVGNIKGPIVGALFVVIVPEILRFIGMPDAVASNLRQIIYGLSLIIVMYYRPKGICGESTFIQK